MSIADKIMRAKSDLEAVKNAGYEAGVKSAPKPVVQSLNVTANGTYTAPNGVDGYSPITVSVPDVNGSYDEGYSDGFEAGKADGGEMMAALVQTSIMLMTGFANTPNYKGATTFSMANVEGWNFGCFYGKVTPGEKYKIVVTRIPGYDYWNTFLFSTGDWMTLSVPATNDNVLEHITVIDDNTYIVTIPEGCLWFNVNFIQEGVNAVYKLN